MRTKSLLILSLAALFCACEERKGTVSEQEEPEWGKASVIVENPIAPGDTLCYHIEFNLDTLSGESDLAKGLSQVLRDSIIASEGQPTVMQAIAASIESLEAEWKEMLAEVYDEDDEYHGLLQYNYTLEGGPVETGNDDVLSYQTSFDMYLGGAHGMYAVGYYNFDKKTGKLINIRDIVPADKEKAVLKAMIDQLIKDFDAADEEDLKDNAGITMLGDVYLTSNFLLKKDSILFLFNPYEIAPFCCGAIDVTVPRP